VRHRTDVFIIQAYSCLEDSAAITRTLFFNNQRTGKMMKTVSLRKSCFGVQFATLQVFLAGALLFLGGCASQPPAPTAQLATSKATADEAVGAGAPEFAPAELSTARDKLDRANLAMAKTDYEQARILGEQAQVDAQLAMTKARSSKAQKAAAALDDDSRVLREEINRKSAK
jgi:hypothetical protein